MKNLLKISLIGVLLLGSTYANDLLSSLTNGKISDSSTGVKVLNLDEMKEVKGGYLINYAVFSNQEIGVYVIPTINAKAAGVSFGLRDGDEIVYDKYGNFDPLRSGLCGIEESTCSAKSFRKLQDYINIIGDPVFNGIGYTVKREIRVSNLGKPFVVFTYGTMLHDFNTGTSHKINSSAILNNNMVVKELTRFYKENFENLLGGWSVK